MELLIDIWNVTWRVGVILGICAFVLIFGLIGSWMRGHGR